MSVSPYVDKNFNIMKYWPIAKDDEITGGINDSQQSRLLAKLRKMKLEEQQRKQNATS